MKTNYGSAIVLLLVFMAGLAMLALSGEVALAIWCAVVLVVSFVAFATYIARHGRF